MSSFSKVVAKSFQRDEEQVHYILQHLIPEYLERLPEGPDCKAIRELFEYEDEGGERQTLAVRYGKAAAHISNKAEDFARRQEPRLLSECARRFVRLDLDDSIDAASLAADVGDIDAPALEPDLSPLAQVLWTQTVEEHKDRLSAIQEGLVTTRRPEEILELVVTMTATARHTLHAIDQTSLESWFTDWRMKRYLEIQLARAREVAIQRLRVVRQSELDDARQVDLLRQFIAMHTEAGARLIICHEDVLRTLNASFVNDSPSATVDRIIMLTIDFDSQPASVISRLAADGRLVKEGTLHLRSRTVIRRYHADLERVKEYMANRADAEEALHSMLETTP